jgi:hypothetical protein
MRRSSVARGAFLTLRRGVAHSGCASPHGMRVASNDGMLRIWLLVLVATWLGSLARLAVPGRQAVPMRARRTHRAG